MTAEPPLLVDWPVNTATGWGVFGLNLTLQLLRQGRHPALLMAPDLAGSTPVIQALLHQTVMEQRHLAQLLEQSGSGLECAWPVFRGLDGAFQYHPSSARIQARHNIGVLFFEDTVVAPEALDRAARLQAIIAGSTWNAELLEDRGLINVHLVPQGIDPSVFHPAPRSGLRAQA